MAAEVMLQLVTLLFGFAFAGFIAALYRTLFGRPVSFRLLEGPHAVHAVLAIPIVSVSAPFIILRNTIRGSGRVEHGRFQIAFIATLLASFWSLMSGSIVLSLVCQFLP